jgi:hypothetical protein
MLREPFEEAREPHEWPIIAYRLSNLL